MGKYTLENQKPEIGRFFKRAQPNVSGHPELSVQPHAVNRDALSVERSHECFSCKYPSLNGGIGRFYQPQANPRQVLKELFQWLQSLQNALKR